MAGLRSTFSYLFDPERCCLVSTLATLYATVLVAAFVAMAGTEIIVFPEHQDLVVERGYLLYLECMSILFLCYVLAFVFRTQRRERGSKQVVNNHKVSTCSESSTTYVTSNKRCIFSQSHGTFTVRICTVLFGTSTVLFHMFHAILMLEDTGTLVNSQIT